MNYLIYFKYNIRMCYMSFKKTPKHFKLCVKKKKNIAFFHLLKCTLCWGKTQQLWSAMWSVSTSVQEFCFMAHLKYCEQPNSKCVPLKTRLEIDLLLIQSEKVTCIILSQCWLSSLKTWFYLYIHSLKRYNFW